VVTLRTHYNCILSTAFITLFVLIAGARTYGQDATGRIIGNVTDPSGSAVAGATVTVDNVNTHIVETTTTNKEGYYQVLSLPIGYYQVTILQTGFSKQVFENQNLQINQSLRLDAQLKLGQQTETVEVQDQAANVETLNETIGTSVTGETIKRAPLNGRNVLDLAALQPGVTETNGDSGAAGNYSIAGGRSDSVTYLLDGAVNNDLLDNGVVFNPNPDTIAEFRILESNYSAEYGRNAGGIISVVTKSGTNDWHGSAFEFLRNDAFNANSFFNNEEGLPRNVLKRNQYGATFGGPIKKNKIFFFVGYQGQRLSALEDSGTGTVYTPAELQGNFSQAVANGQTIAVPTTAQNPNGTFTCGVASGCPDPNIVAFLNANPYFVGTAGNAAEAIIDPSTFNTISKKYIAAGYFPTDPSGQANYQGAFTANNNELTTKLDFLISDKDKVSITFGGSRAPSLTPFPYASVPGFPDTGFIHTYLLNGTYYHSFTTNVVNEFRGFTQRSSSLQGSPVGKYPTAGELGFGVTPDNPTGPPNMWFANGLYVGLDENGPTTFADNTFGFLDTISWVRGKHNIKFGGGLTGYQNNTLYDYYINSEFDFYSYTYGNGGPGTGNPLADFLLGAPSQLFQDPQAPSNIRSKAMNAFFQDEWRVSRNLTVTLGLRYEYSQPKLDTQGRTFSIVPGLQSTVFPNAPVGMVFPGDKGAPVGTNFPDKNNWGPRVGFAWDPTGKGKTSIRGGFGMFYDVLKGEDNLQFNGQPPFFSAAAPVMPSLPSGQVGDYPYFSDPYGTAGVTNPFPSKPPASNINFLDAGFLPINNGQAVYVVDPHLKTPYIYQYSLSLQHELFKNTVFEASYVGNSSHGLTGLQDINPFILGTTDRILNLTPGNSSCTDADGNSSSGVDPSATCSFVNIPEFKNIGKASYNSMQVSLTRQISDTAWLGRTYFTAAYTLGHSIDNSSGFRNRNSTVPSYETNLFRASSDQDVRDRVTISGGWDLPIEHMFQSAPKRVSQGWSVFPIFTWHTGFPFDIFAALPDQFDPYSEGPSGAGDPGNVHANIVGSTATMNPRAPGNYWFNPASFSNLQCPDPPVAGQPPCVPGPTMFPSDAQIVANPGLSTYGTLPRNYLRGPGAINLDMALSKTTNITEHKSLEFRVEFFNIFNHANFLNPNVINTYQGLYTSGGQGTNINSPTFGQITSTADPRIIQLAMRFSF
jgi:hypothetical protein